MKEILNKKQTEYLTLCVVSIFLFFWNLRYIFDIDLIFAMDDEFGYWANAAFFAGKDWSGTVSQCLYYNWGYSLILTPLFWIFKSTFLMRKAALIMNSILVVGMFVLMYVLCRKIFSRVNRYVVMISCLFALLYPYFQVQSNMTMSEIYISFLVVVLINCMYNFIVEKRQNFALISIIVSGMLYFTHQRNLGILIAVVLIIVYMTFAKEVKPNIAVICIMIVFAIIAGNEIVKDYLQANLWENGKYVAINDFSGMQSLFDTKYLISFFSVLCGQLLYLLDATYGLFGIAIIGILSKLIKSIKDKENTLSWYMFVVLAFLGNYGISCIFMKSAIRWDNVIYGRYNESLILFFIVYGILTLFDAENLKYRMKLCVITIFAIVLLTIVVQLYFNNAQFINEYYNYYCAVSLPVYPTADNNFAMYISSIVAVIGLMLLLGAVSVKKEAIIFVFIVMIFNYNNISEKYVEDTLVDSMWGSQQYGIRYSVTEYLKQNIENEKVYYILNGDPFNDMPKGYYQFLLSDWEIECVEYDELKDITDNHYVIIGDFYEQPEDFNEKYSVCADQTYLYKYSR